MKITLSGISCNKPRTLLIFILLLHSTVLGEIHRAKISTSKNGGISHYQQHSLKRPNLSHGNSVSNRNVDEKGESGEMQSCKLGECNGKKLISGGNEPISSSSLGGNSNSTNVDIYVWINSIICSLFVGLSGVLPLLVIPKEAGESLQSGSTNNQLQLFLSFAVGGLLGDVFLHLLPEAWSHAKSYDDYLWTGKWVLTGLLLFLIIEKLMSNEQHIMEPDEDHSKNKDNPKIKQNEKSNQTQQTSTTSLRSGEGNKPIKISGYLNLLANIIDNFTHGLAVGGSFLVSHKVGLITTFAILVHEIPHEVGDFAILLRSGFDRWKAAKAQLLTASGGLLGTLTALGADSIEEAGVKTAWILPFTSGGFIYISLVSIVPELIEETDPKQSFKQILCVLTGIACMLIVTLIFE